jgi:hypothetical protein
MREIRTSGSMRGSGRKALLRKRRLSLSTLPDPRSGSGTVPESCVLIMQWHCALASVPINTALIRHGTEDIPPKWHTHAAAALISQL